MARKTLTAANSVFMLAIPGLYPVPQKIEGYATDEAVDTEQVESAEVMKGVDGRTSAAWIPTLKKQTITIQPDSPSYVIFLNWMQANETARDHYHANATLALPSVGFKFNMTEGVLSKHTPIPGIKKILQPMKFEITWSEVTGAEV